MELGIDQNDKKEMKKKGEKKRNMGSAEAGGQDVFGSFEGAQEREGGIMGDAEHEEGSRVEAKQLADSFL